LPRFYSLLPRCGSGTLEIVTPSRPQRRYSLDDYLSLEEGSSIRHEFFNGEIFAMAGGTVAHNQIAANLLAALGTALKGKPCRALGSDIRLLTPGGLLTYPDVMVICGSVDFARGRRDLVTNPVLLVEVLSEATRSYDLGQKFDLYQALPTLREFLAIEQSKIGMRRFQRSGNVWDLTTFDRAEQVVTLPSIEMQLSLADAYDKVFDS
jgi:Uma2 family endonuclease